MSRVDANASDAGASFSIVATVVGAAVALGAAVVGDSADSTTATVVSGAAAGSSPEQAAASSAAPATMAARCSFTMPPGTVVSLGKSLRCLIGKFDVQFERNG